MAGRIKWVGAAAAALATMVMAAPADAQWSKRYPPRHRDRIDGGDVLLGAIIAGGIIALASSADRARRDRERERYDAPPPEPRADAPRGPYRGDDPYDDARDEGGQAYATDMADEDEAADRCAAAAEDEGRALARIAQVTGISRVDPGSNGWAVRGTLELSDGYRGARRSYGFTCFVADGGATDVRIEGGRYSAR